MEAASVSEIKLMNNLVISWILVTWVMFHITAALEALNSTVYEYLENVMYSKTLLSGHWSQTRLFCIRRYDYSEQLFC